MPSHKANDRPSVTGAIAIGKPSGAPMRDLSGGIPPAIAAIGQQPGDVHGANVIIAWCPKLAVELDRLGVAAIMAGG